MMEGKLPRKLAKEPLVDALFELRFGEVTQAVDVLPGVIFNALSENGSIHHIGPHQVPAGIRDQEPSLRYIPVIALEFEQFFVNIGNRSLSVVCKMPYPGWNVFAEFIGKVLSVVGSAKLSLTVNRFSLKYTDLIEASSVKDQLGMLAAEFRLKDSVVLDSNIQFKVDIVSGNTVHLLSYSTSAIVEKPGEIKKSGVLVEVDSILSFSAVDFKRWCNSYKDELNELHKENKRMFFDSISNAALSILEPIYDH